MMLLCDAHGYALCPVVVTEWDWPDDDPYAEQRVPQPSAPCREMLHLVWSVSIPFTFGYACKDRRQAADDALTDGWEVVCSAGHKLALSSQQEDAEPFLFECAIEPVYTETEKT